MVHNTRMCTREKCIIGIGQGVTRVERSADFSRKLAGHSLQRPATQNYPNWHAQNWSPPTNFAMRRQSPPLHGQILASHAHRTVHCSTRRFSCACCAACSQHRAKDRVSMATSQPGWFLVTNNVWRLSAAVQDKRASRTLRLSCSKGLAHRPSPSAIPSRVQRAQKDRSSGTDEQSTWPARG